MEMTTPALLEAACTPEVKEGYGIWVGTSDDVTLYKWGTHSSGFEEETMSGVLESVWDVQTLTDALFRTISMCYDDANCPHALEHFKRSVSKTEANYYETARFTQARFKTLQAFIRRSERAFLPIAQIHDTPSNPALQSFKILANEILKLRESPYKDFNVIIEDAFAEVRSRMKFTYAEDSRYDVPLEHSESDDEDSSSSSSSDELGYEGDSSSHMDERGLVSRCIRVRF